jgi:hypothetical protein
MAVVVQEKHIICNITTWAKTCVVKRGNQKVLICKRYSEEGTAFPGFEVRTIQN